MSNHYVYAFGVYGTPTQDAFASAALSANGSYSLQSLLAGSYYSYGYTYFEVFFFCHEQPQEPFWPFKFTVGFH